MKVGAVQGSDDFEAVRNAANGWCGGVALGKASRSRLSAVWAWQFFVPLIGPGHAERLRAFRLFVGPVPDRNQQRVPTAATARWPFAGTDRPAHDRPPAQYAARHSTFR